MGTFLNSLRKLDAWGRKNPRRLFRFGAVVSALLIPLMVHIGVDARVMADAHGVGRSYTIPCAPLSDLVDRAKAQGMGTIAYAHDPHGNTVVLLSSPDQQRFSLAILVDPPIGVACLIEGRFWHPRPWKALP